MQFKCNVFLYFIFTCFQTFNLDTYWQNSYSYICFRLSFCVYRTFSKKIQKQTLACVCAHVFVCSRGACVRAYACVSKTWLLMYMRCVSFVCIVVVSICKFPWKRSVHGYLVKHQNIWCFTYRVSKQHTRTKVTLSLWMKAFD